jgi:hypothetical protein
MVRNLGHQSYYEPVDIDLAYWLPVSPSIFYTPNGEYRQGQEKYDSLEDCVATVFRSRPIITETEHRPTRNAITDWASVYVSTKFEITNRASPTWNNRKTFFMHSLAV